jgi:hypothetical protein
MNRTRASAMLLAVVVSSGMAHAQVAQVDPGVAALARDFAASVDALAGTDEARASSVLASSLDPGCEALDGGSGTVSQRLARRRAIAASWRGREVVWNVDGPHARGTIGPITPATPMVCMRREANRWRVAGFVPGE